MLTGPEYQELLELRRLVQEQEQKIEHQSHQLRQQQIQIENLTQALLHARKKLFGPSTEVTQTEGQMSLFEQEELLHSLRQGQEEIVITEHKRKARQPGVRAEMIAALPVEVERCIVDPKEQCPVCKSPLIKVGEKAVRTEVMSIKSGKAKLVLILPDNTLILLAEKDFASNSNEITQTFSVKQGLNRIKLVAEKNTELDLVLASTDGDFQELGINW